MFKVQSFTLLLMLLGANNSFAGEFTNFSRVMFQKAGMSVPANRVCTEDSYLFHKTRDYVEKTRCTGKDESNCQTWEVVPLEQPIESTRPICDKYAEGDCIRFKERSYTQDLEARADVYRSRRSFKDHEKPLRTYWFQIPRCRN